MQSIYHDAPSFKCRIRAHAIVLSDRGYRLEQLADIFSVDRDTVRLWLTKWEEHAFDGLTDDSRPGRPRKTIAQEDAMILREVERHTQQNRRTVAILKKKPDHQHPDGSPPNS